VLSGRGLCDELITHPEESYLQRCVVCNLENLINEEAIALTGLQCHKKINGDKWAPATTSWRFLRLRMAQRPPIWTVAANILNK